MRLFNFGLLASPHNWVVVAFAMLFWAALATLIQPYFSHPQGPAGQSQL